MGKVGTNIMWVNVRGRGQHQICKGGSYWSRQLVLNMVQNLWQSTLMNDPVCCFCTWAPPPLHVHPLHVHMCGECSQVFPAFIPLFCFRVLLWIQTKDYYVALLLYNSNFFNISIQISAPLLSGFGTKYFEQWLSQEWILAQELVQQTIFPHDRMGSGDKTSVRYKHCV